MNESLQDIIAQHGSLDAYLGSLPPEAAAGERRRLQGDMQQRYFAPREQQRQPVAAPVMDKFSAILQSLKQKE